jgi:putative spermidine/putrescine transport system permease protein
MRKVFSWIILTCCAAYLIVPLLTQFDYSLRARRGQLSLRAYENVLQIPPDSVKTTSAGGTQIVLPRFYKSLWFSIQMGLWTIIASTLLIVPTAYWVHLRVPHLKPLIEFFTVLPFAIPGIVLVFGLLRTYSAPPLAMTNTELGTIILLVGGYVIFVMPYSYRAVDNGLRSIDIRSLTDAARSLGAGWGTVIFRVILPNLRVAVLSAALLTFAVAIGEFTLANYLFPDERAFGSYMAAVGRNDIFEPAALTIISFALTWVLVLLINRLVRGSNQQQMTGIR